MIFLYIIIGGFFGLFSLAVLYALADGVGFVEFWLVRWFGD